MVTLPVTGNSVMPTGGRSKASVNSFWALLILVGLHYGGQMQATGQLHALVHSAEHWAYGLAGLQVLLIAGHWMRRGIQINVPGTVGIVIGAATESEAAGSPPGIPLVPATPADDPDVDTSRIASPGDASSGSGDD